MSRQKTKLNVFGASSCLGAKDHDCEGGPRALYALGLLRQFERKGYEPELRHLRAPAVGDPAKEDGEEKLSLISAYCHELALGVRDSVKAHEMFVVIGGDHSCAVGTWSGAAVALVDKGPVGLIWVDAHMDSHTPFTSQSGAIHGMPLAALLGRGAGALTSILSPQVKLSAQNVCLVGVRSFEYEEKELLEHMGVRIYSQPEVKARGLAEVMNEARAIVKENTFAYGLSIDLDAIDPHDAPGVGSPEPNGLSARALVEELKQFRGDEQLLGVEVVELNPVKDKLGRTSALAMDLLLAIV